MQHGKSIVKHVAIRVLIFPFSASIIYLFISNINRGTSKTARGWEDAFFAAASIVALVLMAEVILFYSKKRMNKLYCNLILIILILVFVIFVGPFLPS